MLIAMCFSAGCMKSIINNCDSAENICVANVDSTYHQRVVLKYVVITIGIIKEYSKKSYPNHPPHSKSNRVNAAIHYEMF